MHGLPNDVYWRKDGLCIYVAPMIRTLYGECLVLRGTTKLILSNGEESIYLGTISTS